MAALMIDIEGLDVSPTAAILTIGAQQFDPWDGVCGEAYYHRILLESQEDRTISDDTLEFWQKQPEAIRDEALGDGPDRVTLDVALQELHRLAWQSGEIWVNGPTYDISILENAFISRGMGLPWQYHMVRDVRTVMSLCPTASDDVPKADHNAYSDVLRQITLVQNAFRILNIDRKRPPWERK